MTLVTSSIQSNSWTSPRNSVYWDEGGVLAGRIPRRLRWEEGPVIRGEPDSPSLACSRLEPRPRQEDWE